VALVNSQPFIREAQQILLNNRQEKGFTIPCQGLYPFQWKWDSGFIALGYLHFDLPKAQSELESLLDAQWTNGFIPHIVFHNPSDSYFPGPDFQRADLHPPSSKTHPSSGITQPPVLGYVLEQIYHRLEKTPENREWALRQCLRIFKNLEYFYTTRDPQQEGLVFIWHNWESGTDNSPVWDEIWAGIDAPTYSVQRKDTTHIAAELRPTNREYEHYLHLIDWAKAVNYNEQKIAEAAPFLVQDPLYNTWLIASAQALVRLFSDLGDYKHQIHFLEQKIAQGTVQMNQKLFDSVAGAYRYYDLRNQRLLTGLTSSSFTPLFAGIPSGEQAQKMEQCVLQNFGEDHYLCASYAPTLKAFQPQKYWRGPIWVNLNWTLYQGFKKYHFHRTAERIKQETLALIEQDGFYEYFDPRKDLPAGTQRGYGGLNFSWTAALYLDLVCEPSHKTGESPEFFS